MLELPRHTVAETAALNRLYRRRVGPEVELAGQRYRLELARAGAPLSGVRDHAEVELDGRSFWLSAGRELRDALIGQAFEGIRVPLDERLTACLLEAALEPLLAGLERRLHRKVAIKTFASEAPAVPGRVVPLHLVPLAAGLPIGLELRLDPASLDLIADCFDMLPPAAAPADQILVEGACELGNVRLEAAELRAARPGDLLIIQSSGLDEGRVVLRFGGVVALAATIQGPIVTVVGNAGRHMADQKQAAAAPAAPVANVDAIEVTLTFELGRLRLTLGELRSLGEGHSFDLGKDLQSPVDIMANGQLIGRGALIQIDQRVGVRISQLFDHA